MGRIVWGAETGSYEEGVDQAALYFTDVVVPWNGLISVEELDTSELSTDHYVDGVRVAVTQVLGDFDAQIEAYVYPPEVDDHDIYADSATAERFGLTYRTQHSEGYKIHLVYNAFLAMPQRSYSTVQESLAPSNFVWELHSSAVDIPGASPASHLIIDTQYFPEIVTEIEDIIYGTATADPRFPMPQEVFDMYEARTVLRVVHNGDGTVTVSGPDDMVQVLGDGTVRISSPSLHIIDGEFVVVRSY